MVQIKPNFTNLIALSRLSFGTIFLCPVESELRELADQAEDNDVICIDFLFFPTVERMNPASVSMQSSNEIDLNTQNEINSYHCLHANVTSF